jgi:hypothetical protein
MGSPHADTEGSPSGFGGALNPAGGGLSRIKDQGFGIAPTGASISVGPPSEQARFRTGGSDSGPSTRT